MSSTIVMNPATGTGELSSSGPLSNYTGNPGDSNFRMSGDPSLASGQATGIQRGELLYGQRMGETGQQASDIIRRRREALDSKGPAASRLRESRNRRLRIAKASGASAAQMAQIERESASDVEDAEYRQEQSALDKYQKLVGNIIGGQSSLEMGHAGLEKSGEAVPMPDNSSLFGTVICTELHKQGYMSDEILEKDIKYGFNLRRNDPDTYLGYRLLADPVVELMEKSKTFTWAISIPAMAWARNMAGDKNLLGRFVSYFGERICRFVWRTYGRKKLSTGLA